MKNSKKNIFIIVLIIILIVISLIFFIIFRNRNSHTNQVSNSLFLFGPENITLNYNEEYQEPGFYSLTSDGVIDSDNVIVTGEVISDKPGTYFITYTYNNEIKTRTITVLEKENDNSLNLELIGESIITLDINDEYIDEGAKAYINDIDLSDKIIIDSNLDTSTVGTYTITYKINYNNETKELERKVIVVDNSLKINLTLSNTSYTNSNVKIIINVMGENFNYLIFPNNVITKDNTTSYIINKNGNYTFKAYDKNEKEFSETISISNIDTNSPSGTCKATLNIKNTDIIVNANDDNGIQKYIFYDNNNEIGNDIKSNFTYNKKTSKNIKVKILDIANNETEITCSIIDKSYQEPILPKSDENVIFKGETNTLKAYISKFSNYYLTRIWMYDPYTQANKYDSPEYGKKLYRPATLLKKATDEYNLKDKLLIGFNASGFYLKGAYDKASVKRYSAYNQTSVGTIVITNGKVIRNSYDPGDIKTWFITGITKDNKMVVFEDTNIEETTVAEKKKWSESVINSGIRNTYTFAAPIILNGKKTNSKEKKYSRMPDTSNNDTKPLQLLCQINENNFVLYTSNNSKRKNGINKFLELGCQTAVNLDGGGSIALLYKEKGSSEIKTVVGNGRDLPETGYFSE